MALLKRSAAGGPRRAVWNDVVLAEAPATTMVDGREYFPPDAVDWSRLESTHQTSVCHWKGTASYYDVLDGPDRLEAAAWTYADASPEAAHIRGHVAFWRGVEITAAS